MKKKTKIIIIVSILLIIAIIILIANEIRKYNTHTGTIEYIENNYIQVCLPINLVNYFIESQTPIYDSEGNEINVAELDVEDNIYITDEKNNTRKRVIVKSIESRTRTNYFSIHRFLYSFSRRCNY